MVSSVGSGISGFEEENPTSDPHKWVFGAVDPSSTVTGVRSASFQVGLGSLGKWVSFRVLVDTPSLRVSSMLFILKISNRSKNITVVKHDHLKNMIFK